MISFRLAVVALGVVMIRNAWADYYVDPISVPLNIRESWCRDEKNMCPMICQQMEPGTTIVNVCDPDTLTYGCLCGNNQRPNISEYSLTLPFFICQEWGNQCVAKCNGNSLCASDCRELHPCGAQHPKRLNLSTVSPTPSPIETKPTIYSGPPGLNPNSEGGAIAFETDPIGGAAVGLMAVLAAFWAL